MSERPGRSHGARRARDGLFRDGRGEWPLGMQAFHPLRQVVEYGDDPEHESSFEPRYYPSRKQ